MDNRMDEEVPADKEKRDINITGPFLLILQYGMGDTSLTVPLLVLY